MLAFLGSVIRVIIGFMAASFAAAAVQVLFALTPAELAEAGPSYWTEGGILLLSAATVTALFGAPFALLSALFSEMRGIRSFAYHGIVGIAIALIGHALLYSGQNVNEPTIVNSYAAAAFLTAGFVGGFAYWLFAGRFAYRPKNRAEDPTERPASRDRNGTPPAPSGPLRTPSSSVPVTKPAS
jgi:hypothetical protein